jgi:inorganic pyrophosphatase
VDVARWLGSTVEISVEVSRGGRRKTRAGGALDFVSPVGAPYSYGSVPGQLGGDGDPLDALVLGPPLPIGARVKRTVVGVVRFVDAGQVDDKLVCGTAPATRGERLRVWTFFLVYPWFKRALYVWRGREGRTELIGVQWWSGEPVSASR